MTSNLCDWDELLKELYPQETLENLLSGQIDNFTRDANNCPKKNSDAFNFTARNYQNQFYFDFKLSKHQRKENFNLDCNEMSTAHVTKLQTNQYQADEQAKDRRTLTDLKYSNNFITEEALTTRLTEYPTPLSPYDLIPSFSATAETSFASVKNEGEPSFDDHSLSIRNTSEFIIKIYNFLCSPSTDQGLVRWSSSGETFIVLDAIEFSRKVLPVHFKHNNFSSFIRQLNKYGFRKIKRSGWKPSSTQSEWEFHHELFKRGREDLLCQIKRKRSMASSVIAGTSVPKETATVEAESNERAAVSNRSEIDTQRHLLSSFHLLSSRFEDLRKDYLELKMFVMNRLAPKPNATSMKDSKDPESFIVSPLESSAPVKDRSVKSPKWIRNPHILLVDDDLTCRMLGSKIFALFNCTYELVANGYEALEKIIRNPLSHFDIIFMDIMMPKLDGIEATNQIRRLNQQIPIISMTSNTTESDLSIYLSTGMTDVLAKPFLKQGLLNILEKYLRHLLINPASDPEESKVWENGSDGTSYNSTLSQLSELKVSPPDSEHMSNKNVSSNKRTLEQQLTASLKKQKQ